MSKLISGKEALIALANGEKVLIRSHHWDNFDELTQDFSLNVFFMDEYEFKLKPRTITLNGIEFPCNKSKYDKDGVVWVVSTACENWYDWIYGSDCDSNTLYWETEEEIKQVVEALRSNFK